MVELQEDVELLINSGNQEVESVTEYGAFKGSSISAPPSTDSGTLGSLRDSDTHIRGDDDIISQAMKSCNNVLKYYEWLTILLGWKHFNCRAVCPMLTVFWIILIVATAVFQILTCFRRDGVIHSTESVNTSNSSEIIYYCGGHLISVYIIIDLIHLGIYCYCVYLFSWPVIDGEDQNHLVKKVYYTVTLTRYRADERVRVSDIARIKPIKNLIRALRVFLYCGCLWIGLSTFLRILFSISVGLFIPSTEVRWDTISPLVMKGAVLVVLVILSLVGFIFFDVVYIAAVMNYATQSEFIITLLSAVYNLVKDKRYPSNESSGPLDEAQKDIVKCQTYLKALNRRPATAAALVIFNIGVRSLIGAIALNHADSDHTENWKKYLTISAQVLNNILSLALLAFPFIQAARVTRGCIQLKKTGTNIKDSQVYENTIKYEKDSYLNFTRAIRIRAKLFGVPFYPWMAYAALTIFCFTALILWQSGVYSFSHYL